MTSEINQLEAEAESDNNQGYRIGAVSSLTGISPDALRVWEKRYAVVQPKRTESGNRIYSQEDLRRLSIIKQLLNAGDSIGDLGRLDIPTLKARAATLVPQREIEQFEVRKCRAVVIGLNMAMRIRQAGEQLHDIELIGSAEAVDDIVNIETDDKPDVVILELPSLNESDVDKISHWREQLDATYALVIYRFTNDKALRKISTSRSIPLRAPVDMSSLQRHCEAIVRQLIADSKATNLNLPGLAKPIPPRMYNEEMLADMASISTTIKCECPHHLAELIMALNAFETYSGQCEDQSPKDAALHAYLHETTAQARNMMEQALERLVEVEQISIEPISGS